MNKIHQESFTNYPRKTIEGWLLKTNIHSVTTVKSPEGWFLSIVYSD